MAERKYTSEHTGKLLSSFDKRNEKFSDQFFGDAIFLEGEVLIYCPLCLGLLTHNGGTVEHLVTPSQLKSDLLWTDEHVNANYNHDSNLITVHSGCNSSKGTTDLFEWWASDSAKTRMNPAKREKVLFLVQSIAERTGKTRLSHVTFGEWKNLVFTIASRVLGK